MGTGEKGESKGEQVRGKLKEAVGKVTGNERLKSEGRGEQAKGHVREAKEDVKDTARGFAEGLRGDSDSPDTTRDRPSGTEGPAGEARESGRSETDRPSGHGPDTERR